MSEKNDLLSAVASDDVVDCVKHLVEYLSCRVFVTDYRTLHIALFYLRQYYLICLSTNDSPGYCRLRRQPLDPYFMYIYHYISIDLQSSRSCNSPHCKSLQFSAKQCIDM